MDSLKEEIPVSLQVAGHSFTLVRGKFIGDGLGDLDRPAGGASSAEMRALQRQNDELGRANSALSRRAAAAEGEADQLKYKMQLLLEMLAVAQLDAEKFAKDLEREKLVTETLQHELVAISRGEAAGFGGGHGDYDGRAGGDDRYRSPHHDRGRGRTHGHSPGRGGPSTRW